MLFCGIIWILSISFKIIINIDISRVAQVIIYFEEKQFSHNKFIYRHSAIFQHNAELLNWLLLIQMIKVLTHIWSKAVELNYWQKIFRNVPSLLITSTPWMFRSKLWYSDVNSSPPSAAYMHQRIRSALVQIMAHRLFSTERLSELMLGYCQLNTYEQTSVKF